MYTIYIFLNIIRIFEEDEFKIYFSPHHIEIYQLDLEILFDLNIN